MSQYQNEVNIIGYVGSDADSSQSATQVTRTRFSVATKRFWKPADSSTWENRTDWHDVVAWAGVGTAAAQLKKGSYVRVRGELRSREYEREGVKHKTYEIVANEIHNLRPDKRDETEPVTQP
jgi:single-strand DNA-binding protein